MDVNTAPRTGWFKLPVELSKKERKGLKRILGAEPNAVAWLYVEAEIKAREAANPESAVSEPGPATDRAGQHPKSMVQKVS